ncbi:MAG: PBP1A family penicillin-binding protein [Candidatus Vogelbacteria bacterium]|nr:PBP1A family penicillin-binding protein [Candidatus Vogelbacteria bacterium]
MKDFVSHTTHNVPWSKRLWRRTKKITRHHLKELAFALLAFILILSGLFMIWVSTLTIPDFNSFNERLITQSTKIYDKTGKILLFDAHQDIQRTVVSGDQISRNIKNATVAIEDSNFYHHIGIEPLSLARATWVNLTSGRFSQGGSTITQQVIKNSLLTQQKSVSRKIVEMILAIKLERVIGKDQILALYLNESPYGGSLYGVEEASLAYFGKNANDVTIAEAAYLAAMPQAPSYYSPYGTHIDALRNRQKTVLRRMKELGFITKDEEEQAKAEDVQFAPVANRKIKAPHFVMYVKMYLEEKYGKDVVDNGGLKVTTSLDWEMQQKAEANARKFGPELEAKFNAKNMSIVGVDPKTGQILVMVGSRDYFEEGGEGNFNVAIAHRQPGSTFKPFVYATAFAKGYTPDTILFNLRTEFNANCTYDSRPIGNTNPSRCYSPENYDLKYTGPMTIRNALAQSVNVPAIKALYLAGIKDSIATAKKMGIRGLDDPARYGLTLVLGGGEVSLLDLTEAYSVFANDGMRNPEASIIKVEDRDGNTLEQWQSEPERAISEQVARQITDILTDNEARTPAFGSNSLLYIPDRPVAAKTGTTNNYRDVWIMGYTPNIAVGIWAGNNDNKPIDKKVAGMVVAPVWNSLMQDLLPSLPKETFPKPEPTPTNIKPVLRGVWQGGQEYVIDKVSGALATAETPEDYREPRVVPSVHSILYWVNKNDPLGPKPSNPGNDPQFNLWETPVRIWAAAQGYVDSDSSVIPTTVDTSHSRSTRPTVVFDLPGTSSVFRTYDRIAISVTATSQYPTTQASFYFNNIYIGSSTIKPYSFTFVPQDIGLIGSNNVLKAVVTDSIGNKGEATQAIIISLN